MDFYNIFYRLGLALLLELVLICITLLLFYTGPQTKTKKSLIFMTILTVIILTVIQ